MIGAAREWAAAHLRFTWKVWIAIVLYVGSFFFMMYQGGKLSVMVFIIVTILCIYLGFGRYSGVASAVGKREVLYDGKDAVFEAGKPLTVRIKLQIPGYWPIPYVQLRDRLVRRGGREHSFEVSLVPDWRRHGEVSYLTQPLRRGMYRFAETECVTEDIFGLFEHKGVLEMPHSFTVLPKTVQIREWKQLHRQLMGNHHHSVARHAMRETTQINGVREYNYGDRISRIHWNATAKTGTWKSKEFEREALPKTILVLDRQRSAYPNEEVFEAAVSVAASLFQYAKDKDLGVGLLSVGADSTYFEPRKGGWHYQSIMNHLVDVKADGNYSLMQVVADRSRLFTQGCFFAIITPAAGDAMKELNYWLNHKQMVPCHIWMSAGVDAARKQEWIRQLKLQGNLAYSIAALDDLPAALGGRG